MSILQSFFTFLLPALAVKAQKVFSYIVEFNIQVDVVARRYWSDPEQVGRVGAMLNLLSL
jgi:hypothetical protein